MVLANMRTHCDTTQEADKVTHQGCLSESVHTIVETFFDLADGCTQARKVRTLSDELEYLRSHCVEKATLRQTDTLHTLTERNFFRTSEGGWMRFLMAAKDARGGERGFSGDYQEPFEEQEIAELFTFCAGTIRRTHNDDGPAAPPYVDELKRALRARNSPTLRN
jgi:hypothetical protein